MDKLHDAFSTLPEQALVLCNACAHLIRSTVEEFGRPFAVCEHDIHGVQDIAGEYAVHCPAVR